MEPDDLPSPSRADATERESLLARTNKRLWQALAGMSMIFVAATAAVGGDATDFLGLGPQPAAQTISAPLDNSDRPLLSGVTLTGDDVSDAEDDDQSDPSCIDQIAADVRPARLIRIEQLERSSTPLLTARSEFYRAHLASGVREYVCTIILPDQIILIPAGWNAVSQGRTAPGSGSSPSGSPGRAKGS
jgi:hypothetical protein